MPLQPHLLSYSFLFCSGDAGFPQALGHWDTSHTLLPFLPTSAAPSPPPAFAFLIAPWGAPVTHIRQCQARLWHHLWPTR